MSNNLEKIVLLKLNDKKNVFTTVPKDMMDEVKQKVCGEFSPKSRDTIRGLSYQQERVYLPTLLGIQANDPSFPIKTREFWSDYSLIPTVEGIRLNVATTIGRTTVKKMVNGQDVEIDEEIEIPVNWDDYIAHQFALKSSRVCKDEVDKDMFDFYLVNLEDEKKKEFSDFELKDKADGLYVRLTIESKWEENVDKINWLLELLRDKTTPFNINAMDMMEKKMMLSKFKSDFPSAFILACENKNLEFDALLSKCVTNLVIRKEGNDYYNKDEHIGNEGNIASWFKDPINSGKVMAIKSRLDEIIKTKRTV